jgi:hypothetical protein
MPVVHRCGRLNQAPNGFRQAMYVGLAQILVTTKLKDFGLP